VAEPELQLTCSLQVGQEQEEELVALSALEYVVDLLCVASFLSIDRVEKKCCVVGQVHATVFVKGLPASQASLLQNLQKAMASSLEAMREEEPSIHSAKVVKDVLEVEVEGSQTVCIRLAAAAPNLQ